MALQDKLRRLEKAMRGTLSSFELADGSRYYFDPQEAGKTTFKFLADSLTADYKRAPRPDPPALLQAVANAKNRGEALSRVMGGYPHLPVDREALLARGEFVPRSLVAGRSYEDLGILEDSSERIREDPDEKTT
jgi:hypothetical protein